MGAVGLGAIEAADVSRKQAPRLPGSASSHGHPGPVRGILVGRTLPSLRQMAPGSQLLRDLTDESFPDSVRLTSIYSRRDPFCPPSSCRLDRGEGTHLKNVEVARGGHLVFVSS